MRTAILIVLVAVVAGLAWMSAYTVDPTEYVYVTQFGRHVGTFDGSDAQNDAGLHFGWPWPVQTVRRIDRRLQHFDLPAIELLTHDVAGGGDKASSVDKTLTVEAYVCWRIAHKDHVDRFIRRIDSPERARSILGQRVNSQLGALIGQMRMDDLISTEDGKVDQTMARLRDDLLKGLRGAVLDEYGITIVDVRLKRFNHPVKVRESIFARIISERELKAAHYRNEGKKRAEDIKTIADAKVDLLANAADRAEKRVKREADTEAVVILTDALKQDPNFFRFWHELEQMKSILGSPKTTLLLSTHRSLFDFLFHAPGRDGRPATPAANDKDRGNGRAPQAGRKED
jgi:membrane protease subunit HflC